jgi:serine-type D-Ala-D-Ala carboxypeptidase/endopeptidase (penicillin-binding protein 4)
MMFFPRFLPFTIFGIVITIALSACQGMNEKPGGTLIRETKTKMPAKSLNALDSLRLQLEAFNQDSTLRNASFAYLIYDATADSIIAERNPDLSLVPASTIKLFTTAAALEILGPGANYRTRLAYDGVIENRILKGNLIIKGGGDPTFCIGEQTMNRVFSSWKNSLAKLQIDSIAGNIIGDARIFAEDYIPYTWTWGEINMGYSAAPSGLSFNGNLFSLKFDPTKKEFVVPEDSELAQAQPNSVFLNQVAVYDADDELYLVGFPDSPAKTIRGTVKDGKHKAVVVGVIHDPALVAATLLRKKLIENGINISGKALSTSGKDSLRASSSGKPIHEIASLSSPSVGSLVFTVNQHSNNFLAETLLKQLGVKKSGYGSTEAGIKAVYNFLKSKGINLSGFFMYDGSGISRYNAVTVTQLVELLKYMQDSPVSEIFRNSLSVAGQSGTLGKICSNSEAVGKIQGKSGTMSRVKSYAGYAKTRNNHQLIFAVIVNNFNCTSIEMRLKLEQLFIRMSAL